MFQKIEGQTYYIADIKEWPVPLPIHSGGDTALEPYAEALDNAITRDGLVTGPGKYAIQVIPHQNHYVIFKVLE